MHGAYYKQDVLLQEKFQRLHDQNQKWNLTHTKKLNNLKVKMRKAQTDKERRENLVDEEKLAQQENIEAVKYLQKELENQEQPTKEVIESSISGDSSDDDEPNTIPTEDNISNDEPHKPLDDEIIEFDKHNDEYNSDDEQTRKRKHCESEKIFSKMTKISNLLDNVIKRIDALEEQVTIKAKLTTTKKGAKSIENLKTTKNQSNQPSFLHLKDKWMPQLFSRLDNIEINIDEIKQNM